MSFWFTLGDIFTCYKHCQLGKGEVPFKGYLHQILFGQKNNAFGNSVSVINDFDGTQNKVIPIFKVGMRIL